MSLKRYSVDLFIVLGIVGCILLGFCFSSKFGENILEAFLTFSKIIKSEIIVNPTYKLIQCLIYIISY